MKILLLKRSLLVLFISFIIFGKISTLKKNKIPTMIRNKMGNIKDHNFSKRNTSFNTLYSNGGDFSEVLAAKNKAIMDIRNVAKRSLSNKLFPGRQGQINIYNQDSFNNSLKNGLNSSNSISSLNRSINQSGLMSNSSGENQNMSDNSGSQNQVNPFQSSIDSANYSNQQSQSLGQSMNSSMNQQMQRTESEYTNYNLTKQIGKHFTCDENQKQNCESYCLDKFGIFNCLLNVSLTYQVQGVMRHETKPVFCICNENKYRYEIKPSGMGMN